MEKNCWVNWMLSDAANREAGFTRNQRIEALARLPHAFAPAFPPARPVAAARVKLDGHHPAASTGPVPLVSVFSRAAIELARGCNQGCRFLPGGHDIPPVSGNAAGRRACTG
jgi:hypothetical protein